MGLGSIITAIWQSEEAKKLKKENGARPDYEIPAEYKNILTDAQLAAAEGLPAAQKQAFVENVVRGQSAALQGIASRKGGLTGLVDVNQQGNDAYKQLLGADAAARQQNKQQLNSARQLYGQGQEKQFLLNELYPWMQNDAYQKELTGAAFENFTTGITDIKNTVMGAMSPQGGNTGNPNTATPQQSNQGTVPWSGDAFGTGGNYYTGG